MKGKWYLFYFAMIIFILLAGCGQEVQTKESTVDETITDHEQLEAEAEAETEEEVDTTSREEEDNSEKEAEIETTENSEHDHIDDQEEEGTNHSEGDLQNIGDYEIFLGGEMIETEDKIIVEGVSNLLPKARVIGEVSVGDEKYLADTTELTDEDGSFYMEIPHHNLQEETTVSIKFHFDGPQEDEIIRHYGDRGQKLEGPYIYKHKGEVGGGSPQNIYQMAKAEITFTPGEELAVRQFEEPDWYEIPSDMGDPRVWIEVTEINNDDEYFYLHGKSNLLEGSILRGEYAYNRDETSVKPDGSFDMKFEYEYREDESFEIEFNPSYHRQWNIIEETYGSKGQNLVGNLVEKNRHNDNQSIVIEAALESNEITVPDHVELEINDAEVTMLVPDHLLFEFDEYELKTESQEVLKEIAETLQSFNQDVAIEVSGHTDNIGDEKYNQQLSEKRAEEVKTFLMEQEGLTKANITTIGHGETKPVASNDTEKGQEKNRRVEIIINLK